MTHVSDPINPAAARTPQAVAILDLQERIRFLEADKRMTDAIIANLRELVKKLYVDSRNPDDVATIAERDAQIAALTEALKRAEQTMRNLSVGFLTGDGREIAFNEATNMREALQASAPQKGGTK